MTKKQYDLIIFIRNSISLLGRGPTYRELKEFMSVSSNRTVDDALKAIERKGYIERLHGVAGGIKVTDKIETLNKSTKIQEIDPVLTPKVVDYEYAGTSNQVKTNQFYVDQSMKGGDYDYDSSN